MKEMIIKHWKKMVSVMLVLVMVAGYLPAQLNEVEAATTLNISTASGGWNSENSRWHINLGMDDIITSGGLDYLSGVKIEVNNGIVVEQYDLANGELINVAWMGGNTLIITPTDYPELPAQSDMAENAIYTVTILAGDVTLNSSGTTYNIPNDVEIAIDKDGVCGVVTTTHTAADWDGFVQGDDAGWIRFQSTKTDGLATGQKWSVLGGAVFHNGTAIMTESFIESIDMGENASVRYHLGTDAYVTNGGSFATNDKVLLDCVVAGSTSGQVVRFEKIGFRYQGSNSWSVFDPSQAPAETFTIESTATALYQAGEDLNRWYIGVNVAEDTSLTDGTTFNDVNIKFDDSNTLSATMTVVDGKWTFLLPTETYPYLPSASDMSNRLYEMTVVAGTYTDSDGFERTIPKDVEILFSNGEVLGVLTQSYAQNDVAIGNIIDRGYIRFYATDKTDVLTLGETKTIKWGGISYNGSSMDSVYHDLQKHDSNTIGTAADGYHWGLDNTYWKEMEIAVGDRLTIDCLATDIAHAGQVVRFSDISFEYTLNSTWVLVDESNDISFIKLDTTKTTQRDDDGMWLIYLYTSRAVGTDAGTTIKVQVNGSTYDATLLGQGSMNQMIVAISADNLSVADSTMAISIPCQPNLVFDGNVATVNIAKEFTFYLYSNGTFGVLGDSDGTVAGNVNGDDEIGSKDIICLKKYLADNNCVEHKEHSLKTSGADANGNGYIEERDLVKLYEYILEGWTCDGSSYEAGTQIPVYLDDGDMQLAAYKGPDALTDEAFSKYKEAGFNTIIHEDFCAYSSTLGVNMWYDLKQYMRLAQKYDLDVLITSQELNDYLLNGNEGDNEEDTENWKYSVDRLIAFMNGLENNSVTNSSGQGDTEAVIFDNFIGFVMADEPDNESAIMNRYETAKAYIDTKYAAAFNGRKPVLFYSLESYESELFTTISGTYLFNKWWPSKKVTTAFNTHSTFLSNYGNITGGATVDRYPFRIDSSEDEFSSQDPNDGEGGNYLDAGWLYQLELLAAQGKANAFKTGITLQSVAFTHNSDNRRAITSVADVMFEMYSALAYGMHSVNYFTYNIPTNPPEGEEYSSAMADDDTVYNAVQTVNNQISKFDYILNDYDWVATNYYGTSSDGLFGSLAANTSLPNITSVDATNAAIVSHMKDYEKSLDGYWMVNVTDPEDNQSNTVSVTFDSTYTKAIAFVDGEKKLVSLTSGVYQATLAAGEGVFIIPLKIAE